MPFLTINGHTVQVFDATPSRQVRRRGRRDRSYRGKMRDGQRGHRREFDMTACFSDFEDAETLISVINGEGHLAFMNDGIQGSTGLYPEVLNMDDITYDPSAIPFGAINPGAFSGASTQDVWRYEAQLGDQWGLGWYEFDGSSWRWQFDRDDGSHWTDAVRDDDEWGGEFEWKAEVSDGRVKISNLAGTGNDIAHVMLLPYRPSTAFVESWGVITVPWGPLPALRIEGDMISEDFELMFGEVTSVDFVEKPSLLVGIGWLNNAQVVNFKLTEIPEGYLSDPQVDFQGTASSGLTVGSITTPQELPLNALFSFTPSVSGAAGALTVTNIGTTLPANLSLNSSTGTISGTPLAADLITDNGDLAGNFDVQLSITDGVDVVQTNVFRIAIQGVSVPGPTIYYSMDDADVSGATISDTSGSGIDATIAGGASIISAAGNIGESRDIGGDGSADYANANYFNDYRDPFSVFCSINPDTVTTGYMRYIVEDRTGGVSNSVELGLDQTDGVTQRVRMSVYQTAGSATATSPGPIDILLGAWGTGGGTWGGAVPSGGSGELYAFANGLRGTLATSAGACGVSGNQFFLFGDSNVVDRGMDGKVDDFGWWSNVELSNDQMATLHWISSNSVSMKTWIGF